MAGKDQRRYERYPVFYEAHVKRIEKSLDPAALDRFLAKVIDISRGGVCLELKELVYPKEHLRLVVEDQAAGFALDVATVVRWSDKVTGGYKAGMQFTEVKKLNLGDGKDAGTNAAEAISQTSSQGTHQASKAQASARPSQS
jgi:hypothetical protein